ncbi:hypothetical protein [Paractinoplanes hotanensis]|uniref:Uncharacterized protein n=1 Tax=Paractinoplanes hotanensis TaxID=2906497 RepID=A0ABT0Y3U3_9ACTN|nr:hypothetical protein [Actinoplanes hotanensis]MCM4080681.1 hypothetical protein [Actinoplanes hotanensis]
MKFFSNEKETETEPQADPDRTQAVSVPPQRAGSPWSDAPRESSGDTSTDAARPSDGPDDTARRDDVSAADVDAQPAGHERQGDTTEKAVTSTTYGPDGSVVEDTSYRAAHTERPQDDSPVDLPLTDSDARPAEDQAVKDDGTFDSPKAVDPATGEKLDGPSSSSSDKADDTDRVDSEDFQPASDTPSPVAETAAVPVGAVAAPKATTPGSTTGDKLLPDGDSFAERFRDIQLRFVDEPKEATAEAATLVGDAVDKLTSALKAQRDGLAGNSDDTEKLRVELRAYRDILNRLLAL